MSAVLHSASAWRAILELEFAHKGERTIISRRKHYGPLTIQRPFYPEQEVCHVYLLHPPGGIVGGDVLLLDVNLHEEAHALLTTPASTKFYRSNGRLAEQRQVIHVAKGGIMEWMPQETIIFDAARCATTTEVHLDAGASFAGWEIICQGRPASGEAFGSGEYRQCLEIYRQGKPLIIERTRLQGGSDIQTAQWGMAGYPVSGTMLITGSEQQMLELARSVNAGDRVRTSVTLINDVLVCRYLGMQGIEAREFFTRVWQAIRQAWNGRPACPPRIWYT